MGKKKFFKNANMVNQEQIMQELITSIQKNYCCLDLLETLEQKYGDNYKFTENQDDKASYEQIQWIRFQITYLVEQYGKALKELGGNPNAIQSIIWK